MIQIAKPSDGTLYPEQLPDMAYGDTITLNWNLSPALDDATITSISFVSCPEDFSFTTPTIDGGNVMTTISGAKCAQDYVIQATLVTGDGQTRHPKCAVRCV